ncbi:hypothetical protein [Desulfosarcina variabilis]|uniref:hypothetical protein n=1 Tax=Desulfosarcina variabilis TaxID=2300 RepID=UPI003AFA081B
MGFGNGSNCSTIIDKDQLLSPSDLANAVDNRIENEKLSIFSQNENGPVFFARPRRLALAGAINRLRNLNVEISSA